MGHEREMLQSFVCTTGIARALARCLTKLVKTSKTAGLCRYPQQGLPGESRVILQILLGRSCVLAFAFAYGLIKRL